jgi:hypothetical protein
MNEQNQNFNVAYPDQTDLRKDLNSLINMLKESTRMLTSLRREMRGEVLMEFNNESFWVQMIKPKFVKVDMKTGIPYKQKTKLPDGSDKEVYVTNDEAIEEVLSLLRSMGINDTTKLTDLDESTIITDLRLFEKKLASLLCLKQKEWGIDKEILPLLQLSLGTMVQDARYQAKDGAVLVSLQKSVQRIEQVIEGNRPSNKLQSTSTPFS